MTTDAETDTDLLIAIRQGDRIALATLYDRHAAQMLGLAIRILNNRRDAEDLLHDVFIEVWQKAGDFDPSRGAARTWLLLKLRCRAIDRLRMLTVARNHAMVQIETASEDIQTEDDPSLEPDRIRARQALSGLTREQRMVVELGYFQGLKCREIAERCRIPVGTVKSRLAAAMSKLRLALDPGRTS